jgi:hypothetical protein
MLPDRAVKLVKKATTGAEGTPDWSSILEILSILESSPSIVRAYLRAIHTVLNTANHAVRMNVLILIDALFKNCKKECLPELQSAPLFRALEVPGISDDPDLHNFLAKSVPAWVSNCTKNQCLDPALTAYAEFICKDLFTPVLTPAMVSKLQDDFETSFEVLELMAQLLARGAQNPDGFDRAIVAEVLPNVREIGKRAGELEQVILDSQIHPALTMLRQLSLACQQGVSDLRNKKFFDASKLLHAVLNGQAVARARRSSPAELVIGRRRKVGDDEMSVDDFFERFDSLKGTRVAPLPGPDALIDFSTTFSCKQGL